MMITGKFNIGLYVIPGFPLVSHGDDIAGFIYEAAKRDSFLFEERDIIVIAHKIVSKAESALVNLAEINPSATAVELADKTERDPRFCQVVLNESREIIGINGRYIVTRHRLGHVGTEAGIDRSNAPASVNETAVLLPRDPDASARRIRDKLRTLCGKELAVIICDTFGSEYRRHSISWAIGIAGIKPVDTKETTDLFGRTTQTSPPQIDEIATAAGMMMGQGKERTPVVVIRGVPYTVSENANIRDILNE